MNLEIPNGYKELKEEFQLSFDEPWGSTMNALFTLYDVLTFHHEVECPAHWEFRPSFLGNTSDPDDPWYGICEQSDPDELIRFGNLLFRYSRLLEKYGHSY